MGPSLSKGYLLCIIVMVLVCGYTSFSLSPESMSNVVSADDDKIGLHMQ